MKNTKKLICSALVCALAEAPALDMMNVAHRGLWKEAGVPQNTVEAIRAAYDAGARVVETDFTETDSGEIICLHDIKALATMSSIVKEPKAITPADRAVINLGEKDGLPRPYRIPLLADVLAVVPRDCVLQAEIKGYGAAYAKKFDDAVRAAGLSETNVVVSSFHFDALKDFHAKYPAYRTLWLGCGIGKAPVDVEQVIAKAREGGFAVVCPGCADAKKAGVTAADTARIRAAGFDFRVYGVNTPEALAYAAGIGASGFTCNYHLAAYGWARKVKGVRLLPDRGALIPDDFKGCLSKTVRTVGIVMPASIASRKDYLHCKAMLAYAGYRMKEAPRLNFKTVAPVADRVADFEQMWLDPEVDLVLCARGGKGCEDLVDRIDWAKLRSRNDQRVLGFSNVTWLLNAMVREGVGHPISGPTLTQFRYLTKPSLAWLASALGGGDLKPQKLRPLRSGAVSGLPCGGHITILDGMRTRKRLPETKGRVVFLECSAREPGVVRNCLDALLSSGWFEGCSGVVFGDITAGDAKRRRLKGAAKKAGDAEIDRIKRDFAAKAAVPVFDGYRYGHVPQNFAIDFRRTVGVTAEGILTFSQH